ncbi:hypothetical protein DOTSEDRAFT_23486 [Dothistroma septosporum NZE10]|uniref:BTB domain-containing protein n=1 Tax=Dothistroma septosporum (strain NZE10 / CBS 128990) TaxID=675120 RepID=N1PSW9_DOTSN|nr:hypothetical protein DOTSEDRAFT_23486 [Dothistroma septosporum NZE10]
MQRLTTDQYTRLLETERVILTAKGSKEQIFVHKGFLALHSTFFAKVIDKPSAVNEAGQAGFEIDCAATAIRIFARWCYEGQFHRIDVPHASIETLIQRKLLLIDLWIFGETYGIATIQNEAMDHLAQVLTAHPRLLTKVDVEYTFLRTTDSENNGAASPLRHFVIMIVAVMLEVNAKNFGAAHVDEGVKEYEQYAQSFPGFMSLMYKWQRAWLIIMGKAKSDVGKLPDFVRKEGVQRHFLTPETEAQGWILSKYGVDEKEERKRESLNEERESEVIVIDDDWGGTGDERAVQRICGKLGVRGRDHR